MQRLVLAAAALAVTGAAGVANAWAANFTPPPPGTPIYGPLVAAPPTGEVPPADAPPGYHYEWVYSYDHHGYRAHWEAVRNS
jgi:hypothetical protein